jgi:hypothetical protein
MGSGAGGRGELGSRELGVCGIWTLMEMGECVSTEEGVCGICPPGERVERVVGVSTGDGVREGSIKK